MNKPEFTEDPKQCPFCGCFPGIRIEQSIDYYGMWYRVVCLGCKATQHFTGSREKCIENWNKRICGETEK